jgi:hypothetical protein
MENVVQINKLNHLTQVVIAGKPTIPSGKQPKVERKYADPSSSCPKGERYPIPSFEYRVRANSE